MPSQEDPVTPKPATSPDFIPTPLPPSDLDDLSPQQLRNLIEERDSHIRKLSNQLQDLRQVHSELLERSANWKDELEAVQLGAGSTADTIPAESTISLSDSAPSSESSHQSRSEQVAHNASTSAHGPSAKEVELQAEVTKLRSENATLEDQIRDLRIRSEESRRAIMRLQNEQSDIRAKAKAENRRSLAVGPTTWNPATLAGMADADEARELRKSKRASLVFGPNAAGVRTSFASAAAAQPSSSHRRTASGGSTGTSSAASGGLNIDTGAGAEPDMETDVAPLSASSAVGTNTIGRGPTRMSGGLRGLRLSGIFSPSTGGGPGLSAPALDDDKSSASRRASFNSATSGGPPRSPIGETPDSSQAENGEPAGPPNGNRQRLSYRQSSSSTISTLSNGYGEDNLGLPGGSRPFSVSPSPSLYSKVGSPIMEENDGARSPDIAELEHGVESDSPRSRFATLTGIGRSNTGNNRASVASAAAAFAAQADLQAEVDRLKKELAKTKADYEEAEEARSASEECLRALKDFIAKHDEAELDAGKTPYRNVAPPPTPAKDATLASPSTPRNTSTLSAAQTAALKGLKLPPLPSSTEMMDDDDQVGSSKTPVASTSSSSTSSAAPSSVASTASTLWSSSSWGARFSGFPQLMRMSTGTSTTSNATSAEASEAGSAPAPAPAVPSYKDKEMPLSPSASINPPLPTLPARTESALPPVPARSSSSRSESNASDQLETKTQPEPELAAPSESEATPELKLAPAAAPTSAQQETEETADSNPAATSA
ncbi:hypothetical protein V8E36_009533 [Tilletia maclaganii]